MSEPGQTQRVVLVSGPAGAGRSTAINALEDFGYETIDNIPLRLIPRLLDGGPLARPLALGIDARNRDFSADSLVELRDFLVREGGVAAELLYLDCAPEVLGRRYSETRRRHPLAPNETPGDGIARDLALLATARWQADVLIDTTDLTVHELRAEMEGWFKPATGQEMALTVQSFSYKRGLPQGLDMVFDCRFLRNPHWSKELRPFTGMDAAVVEYIRQDARYGEFYQKVLDLTLFVLPGVVEEGKTHFAIGFGCTGGKHRSVALAQSVNAALAKAGWRVSIRHRELERRSSETKSAGQGGRPGKDI